MTGLDIWHQIGDKLRESIIRHTCDADVRTLTPENKKPVLTIAQALEVGKK